MHSYHHQSITCAWGKLNGLDESNGFYIYYVPVGIYFLDAELECWSGPHSSSAGTFEDSETRRWSLGVYKLYGNIIIEIIQVKGASYSGLCSLVRCYSYYR